MKAEIYRKHVSKSTKAIEGDDGAWHGEIETNSWIVLTEEINKFIVWELATQFEDETATPIKTFDKYERNTAIEFTVHTADQAIIDAAAQEPKS